MTDHTPHTTGETLDQLLERVIFANPATHPIRERWEETKRTEQAAFERVCREEYERRLRYHRICRSPDPEGGRPGGRRPCASTLLGKSSTSGSRSGGRRRCGG
jgi:hypothetical protein